MKYVKYLVKMVRLLCSTGWGGSIPDRPLLVGGAPCSCFHDEDAEEDEGDDDDDDDDDDTASGPLPEEPEECFVLCLIRLLKICEPFKRRFGFLMPNTTIADGVLLMSTFRRHIL